MQIIPVLDIMDGLVVRGVMGDRANYRPMQSPLSPSPNPVDMAKGLSALGAFGAFYIADLDAIEARAPNAGALDALCAAFPATGFWVDAGVRTVGEARALLVRPQVTAVVGSETVENAEVLAALSSEARVVLSLDYRGQVFMGPAELETQADLWPSRVIAMTLSKVGSGAGPDLARLGAVKTLAGTRQVFAAGGVRDAEDLQRLKAAGIAGALVASALHDGHLDRAALARLEG